MGFSIYQYVEKTYEPEDWEKLSDYYQTLTYRLDCIEYNKVHRKRKDGDEISYNNYAKDSDNIPISGEIDAFLYRWDGYTTSVEDSYIKEEIIIAVNQTLQLLKPSHRKVIEAVFFDGLTATDYAKIRGVSPQAAASQYRTAKKNFRKIFEKCFQIYLQDAY